MVLLFFISQIAAQRIFVKGQVVGTSGKEALPGANVMLYLLPDSTMKGTTTDSQGRFTIDNVKNGNYLLVVSYIGYDKHTEKITIQNKSVDLQKIILNEDAVQTGEVEVVGQMHRAVIKKDTTEFNAGAFQTSKDAVAEDLVSKIPGVTVKDGKVQAQGEDVKRVLIDGKPFFGDDPNAVLKTIPAEIVDKVQIFDQQSEQSQFTGYDDGNSEKAMNLITRTKITNGTFGNLHSGYGDEKRHKVSGNINFFEGDRKISILGQINNINEQNFSMEDLSGMMSSMGGGRGHGGGGPMMGGGFGGGGFFVNASGGLSKTKAFGINYTDKWSEKLSLTTSYFYNNTENDATSVTDRLTFLTQTNQQNYLQNKTANSLNINHRFNMRFEYKIDERNSILFRPRLTVQDNEGSSLSLGTTSANNLMLNSSDNKLNTNYLAYNFSSELLYRHSFETKGRTFSIEIENTIKNNDGNNHLNSLNSYFTTNKFDTLDQKSSLLKKGYGVDAQIDYTEPLSEKGILRFSFGYSVNEEKNDQNTFKLNNITNNYSDFDKDLSNVYKRLYSAQTYNLGYMFNDKDINFNIGLGYNISKLNNNQSFPYNNTLDRTFTSFLPSAMLRINFSRETNLRMFYRSSNNAPGADQLQNVLNNTNQLLLSIGNPNLKQDTRHFVMLRYSTTDMKTLNSFFVHLFATYTNDYIGNRTTIATKDTLVDGIALKRGSQLTKPENLNGQTSINSFLTYSLPVWFLKSNLNLNASLRYSKTPGIINDVTNNSNLYNYGIGFVLATNFSRDFDVTLSSSAFFNNLRNSVKEEYNDDYFNLDSRIKLYWNIWNGFIIQTNINHKYDSGLPSEYNQNAVLWNAYIAKKLFSKDQGEIRFSVFDIMNKSTSIQRTVTDSYVEDTRSNSLGRYYMVSFIYNLKAF